MGRNTDASGDYSTASGYVSFASGKYSAAMGVFATAWGDYSTAMGYSTNAASGFETVLGRYNTSYMPNDSFSWNSADRLFVVGNGTSSSARSDAMVILKNGNVGIGNSDPEGQLFVQHTSTASGSSSGILVDWLGDHWKTYHSGLHYSFANEGTRYAYIEDNTGN